MTLDKSSASYKLILRSKIISFFKYDKNYLVLFINEKVMF